MSISSSVERLSRTLAIRSAPSTRIYRVLKPGGKASIFDLRKEASLAEIDAEVRGMGLSWLNALLTRFTFRSILLKTAYNEADLDRMVAAAGSARARYCAMASASTCAWRSKPIAERRRVPTGNRSRERSTSVGLRSGGKVSWQIG